MAGTSRGRSLVPAKTSGTRPDLPRLGLAGRTSNRSTATDLVISLPLPARLKRPQPFPSPHLSVRAMTRPGKLPDTLSRLGIAGGAVYDALVALAAKEHGTPLANEVPTKR